MSKDIQKRRRSSIKNLPVHDELRNIRPQEVFSDCPELQNFGRLSGNTTRNSWNQRKGSGAGFSRGSGATNIPTPCSSAGRGRGGKLSSGPRNLHALAAGNRSTLTSAGRAGSAGRSRGSSATRPGRGGGVGMKPPAGPLSRALSVSSLSSTLNNTRRKSKSYDSLLQTPAFTPGIRSRSKSPGQSTARRRGGVINDAADQGKNIKITKDKKAQSDMAKYIFDFLDAQGCQAKPAHWNCLMNPPKISVNNFTSIVKFLASHFVGEAFFANVNPKANCGDDISEKILELSKILRYPGTMNKSHLKTANTQHAWPTCFTFLAWLCCRTNSLLNPPQERTGIDELASHEMQEYAFESYLTLFPAHFKRALTQEAVDEELANFKARIREAEGIELTKTKEELLQDREAKKAELEQLKNAVDPSKEYKERFAAEHAALGLLRDRIKEIEINCKKYSNTNHLVLELERLELDIEAKESEVLKLKKQVASQTLSKEAASAVISETEALRVQLTSLTNVVEQLTKDCENRTKSVEVFRNDLYQLCSTFSIVERYNEIVRFLHMDELVIAPNPFATQELEDWMKVASKTLRLAEAKVKDMVRKVEFSSDQKTKETMEYQQQIDSFQQQVNDLKLKLQHVEKYNKFLSEDFEQKYNNELSKLSEETANLQREEGELNKCLQSKDVYVKSHQEWTECLEGYRKGALEWKGRLLKETEKFALEMARAKEFILNATENAARRQQEFFIQHFGVDIFANDDSDEASNTTG